MSAGFRDAAVKQQPDRWAVTCGYGELVAPQHSGLRGTGCGLVRVQTLFRIVRERFPSICRRRNLHRKIFEPASWTPEQLAPSGSGDDFGANLQTFRRRDYENDFFAPYNAVRRADVFVDGCALAGAFGLSNQFVAG